MLGPVTCEGFKKNTLIVFRRGQKMLQKMSGVSALNTPHDP